MIKIIYGSYALLSTITWLIIMLVYMAYLMADKYEPNGCIYKCAMGSTFNMALVLVFGIVVKIFTNSK